MRSGKYDRKHQVLIKGAGLRELKELDLAESFGLDSRIERYDFGEPQLDAAGNVTMVEMCTHLAIERARMVTLHLQQARRSSIPTKVLYTPCDTPGKPSTSK